MLAEVNAPSSQQKLDRHDQFDSFPTRAAAWATVEHGRGNAKVSPLSSTWLEAASVHLEVRNLFNSRPNARDRVWEHRAGASSPRSCIRLAELIGIPFEGPAAGPVADRWAVKVRPSWRIPPVSFDIRQLRYALAAASHGIFYRASRALDVEQSTFSRSILKLERSIRTPTLAISVKTNLTGGVFIQDAKPLVATVDKLVAMTRAAEQGRRVKVPAQQFGIGRPSSAILMSWHERHPDARSYLWNGTEAPCSPGLTLARPTLRS